MNTPTMPLRVSEHFLLSEVEVTQHRNIDNSLPPELLPAAKNTAKLMERVRSLLQSAIIVNSWYRCRELNIAVGSNPETTQHRLAEAVDFISPYGSSLDICKKILAYPELIVFDQLILEHSWVHISRRADPNAKNRMQVLSLLKGGKYASGLTNKDGVPYGA